MKRCPHCHSPITQPDRKTCPVCGNPLSGPAGAARRRLPLWVPMVLLSVVAVVVVYFALHKPASTTYNTRFATRKALRTC